ncbi:beta-defensin 109 [Pipistrellus kuhlii]|uniref:beta-defensin 109 n=1 Tax=Pipistrellus kuhlii TaxID=59472 RepID=UPI00174F1A4F|nr:beta-defensin 109 [Pipistrellus kuhlii]
MRHHVLLSTLLLLTLLPPVRSGLGPSESHCLNLSGTCRRDICKVIEDTIGACRKRYPCCRAWWVLIPVPTPSIYSDYQEPLKPRVK